MLRKMNSQARNGMSGHPVAGDRRHGFTLAEILVALGILAIGMSMVAAIFPAAMEFNRTSTNSTLGSIICENGLILSELALTAEIVDALPPGRLAPLADDMSGRDVHISRNEQHYPTGQGDARTGFAMLARKISAAGSTYQLVTVAYRKSDKDNKVALLPVTCTFESGADRHRIKTISPGNTVKIGTPLINVDTGEFAMVNSINVDATTATLDIDPTKRNIAGGSKYYVLVEVDPTNQSIGALRRSPAIGAMSKVTGLRHDLNP
jgi:prepilin-type N-terminal cleavage/methylation domain-containing protein